LGVRGDDVNTVWYKVDGPGRVDFGDKNVVKTWARFSEQREFYYFLVEGRRAVW
jgi:hypothetical protein